MIYILLTINRPTQFKDWLSKTFSLLQNLILVCTKLKEENTFLKGFLIKVPTLKELFGDAGIGECLHSG